MTCSALEAWHKGYSSRKLTLTTLVTVINSVYEEIKKTKINLKTSTHWLT